MIADTADRETLKLVKAFYRIKDPIARRIILSLTEAAARGVTLALEHGPDEPEDGDRIGSSA